MRKIVYKSKFIKAVVVLVAFLLVLTVWPLRMYKEEKWVLNPPQTEGKTEVINYLNTSSQVFVASQNHLETLNVWVAEGTKTEEFTVTLHNAQNKLLATQVVTVPQNLPGYAEVMIDVDTVPQELYTLKFSSIKSLYLGEEPWYNPETIAVSYHNTDLLEGMNIVMDYGYKIKLTKWPSLLFIGIIVFLAAVLFALTELIFKNKDKEKLITIEHGMKWVLNPLTCIFILGCYVCIALGLVSRYLPDNVFALTGVTLLGGILLYGINHSREGQKAVVTSEYLKSHVSDFVQSVAIAGAIQGCCSYVSALYDINHYVAERRTMLWFAFIIIAMFSLKEIFNFYNLGYLILAVAGGIWYYKAHLTEGMTQDDIFVLKANVAIAILLGFILIRTIKVIVQKKSFASLNKWYVIISGAFLAMTIVFRNTRWWTVTLAVSFGLLIINMGFWKKRKNFITNVIRGVILQFMLCTVWVWMYRPYSTYRTTRYTHFFHTSTVTATYMTAVGCVVAVLLLSKIRKCVFADGEIKEKLKLRDIWKELVLFGMVMAYLIFTMARTAYAAMCVALLFGLVFMLFEKGQKSFGLILKTLGWMIVAVAVMIPVTFEIQRTVPCLVSEPYEYDIDNFMDDVKRGHDLSQPGYMTVGRLADEFCEKILGHETSFDSYHNADSDFNEYHATFKEAYERTGYTWPGVVITDEMWDQEITDQFLRDAYLFGYSEENLRSNYSGQMYEPSDEYLEQMAEKEASGEATTDFSEEDYPEDYVLDEAGVTETSVTDDFSNGRFDIYRDYIGELNLTGHPAMGFTSQNGREHAHAHDVYLQVAFDHGIPTGIVFVVFGFMSLVMSVIVYLRKKNENPDFGVTFVTLVGFAVAGVVEWTYHLCHPMGFILWLTIVPLMFEIKKKEQKQ